MPNTTPHTRVKVWDLPVRLFHWTLLGLCGFAWWSAEEGGLMLRYHMWAGYSILTLVLFRVVWGVVGSRYARFAQFVRSPRVVWRAVGDLLSTAPLSRPGHNPLGGWMVVALLACLLVQTGTGLFANDDILNEGPLYKHVGKELSDTLTGVHHLNFSVLLTLVGMHVLAILYHWWRKGERLVAAMFSGYQEIAGEDSVQDAAMPGPWRALLWLAAIAGGVAVVINL